MAGVSSGARRSPTSVQQITKLKMAVNLKAAKPLGVTVPPSLLGMADALIE